MDETSLTQSRDILLPDGSIFTLTFNERFLDKVRKYYELESDEDLTDVHLKEFFAASLAGV